MSCDRQTMSHQVARCTHRINKWIKPITKWLVEGSAERFLWIFALRCARNARNEINFFLKMKKMMAKRTRRYTTESKAISSVCYFVDSHDVCLPLPLCCCFPFRTWNGKGERHVFDAESCTEYLFDVCASKNTTEQFTRNGCMADFDGTHAHTAHSK